MKHPELLLMPLMMFCDYFLTVLGAIKWEKGYSSHFRTERYELNPLWQKSITRKQWFNVRHIALTIGATGALVFLFESGDINNSFADIILGALLVFFAMILGIHLGNLLVFTHLARRPEEVTGEVIMTSHFVLCLSLYQGIAVFSPLLLVSILSPSYFCGGGLLGILLYVVIHVRWMRSLRNQGPCPDTRSGC